MCDTSSVTATLTASVEAGAGRAASSRVVMDGAWWLTADPQDVGLRESWEQHPPMEFARPTLVPSALQETLPGYHGVAWYWRDVTVPVHEAPGGRYLLSFTAVDHGARVWVNGTSVGSHEGGETPFVLDVTDAVRAGTTNRIVVRVVNPTVEGIDGLRLEQVAHRNRQMPFRAGASWNLGGITGPVDLLLVPRVRVEDLWVQAALGSERVRVVVQLRNASADPVEATMAVTVAPAASGHTLAVTRTPIRIEADSSTRVEAVVAVDPLEPWDLDHPVLYRASATVDLGEFGSTEANTRFGVRDFRFIDGAFQLNGRRLFLRMTHTVNDYPLAGNPAATRALLRRDLVHLKILGFTMVRFIWGAATPEQLDLCDELGLLVYSESFASWPISDSPQMRTRFSAAVDGLVRRDRNHPSIVIWGLLNELHESDHQLTFQHAVAMLPRVVQLDGTRMIALNSGRFDRRPDIASFANPGSTSWDVPLGAEQTMVAAGEGYSWPPTDQQPMGTGEGLGDVHIYPRVPHTATTIRQLRGLGQNGPNPIFVSEYGIGSAVDLWRVVRQYEEHGAEAADDAVFYRSQLDRFLEEDWGRWRLNEVFGHPAEFFAASLARTGGERARGIDALRANPQVIGYGLTGAVDQVMCGEGLATTFRELKPGTVDALIGAFAPARWCVFTDAEAVYRGPVRFEVVLANDGDLAGENLPVLAQVFDVDGREVWRHESSLTVPPAGTGPAPMVIPALDETVRLDGPAGMYTFHVGFERGGAPTGGLATIRVFEPVSAPDGSSCTVIGAGDQATAVVHLLGPETSLWDGGPLDPSKPVLIWDDERAEEGTALVANCSQLLAAGGTVICLSALPYTRLAAEIAGAQSDPGEASSLHSWLYLRDDWGRRHPIFAGLPTGGLLDYSFYRNIISDEVFRPGGADVTGIAGAVKASQGYDSALTLWESTAGAGRLIGSTFRLRGLIGGHPVADRMLVNLVIHGASPVTG